MKPVFKLEGVTRTAVNLENYSKKEVCGQTRALHVSIKQSDEEDEKYYTYILSKINKTTFNYRCNHWGRVSGRRGVKCQATLSCKTPFSIEEKPSAGKTKNWKISIGVNADDLNNVHNYEIFHNCSKLCATKCRAIHV